MIPVNLRAIVVSYCRLYAFKVLLLSKISDYSTLLLVTCGVACAYVVRCEDFSPMRQKSFRCHILER